MSLFYKGSDHGPASAERRMAANKIKQMEPLATLTVLACLELLKGLEADIRH
jgi:hypothetical protein